MTVPSPPVIGMDGFTLLGAIPGNADTLYLHDVVVDPIRRSLGLAGTVSQFVGRIPLVYAMTHFQLDDLEFHREGPDPKAVSPEELERRLQSAEFELSERNSYDFVIHSKTKEQDFRALLDFWAQAKAKLGHGC